MTVTEPNWPMLRDEYDIFGICLMSNFDHEVNQEVEQKLRDGQVMAKYSGWNFNADCWFDGGQFHAAVYRYHTRQVIMSADTPKELMKLVSDQFGWD